MASTSTTSSVEKSGIVIGIPASKPENLPLTRNIPRKQTLAPLNFVSKIVDLPVESIKKSSVSPLLSKKSIKSGSLSDSLSSDGTLSCEYELDDLLVGSVDEHSGYCPLTVVVSPTESVSTDSGFGTPCISSASTSGGSAGSSGRRRRAAMPLSNTSDEDSGGDDNILGPSSPSESSSSASEPQYVRPPGFKDYAKEYKPTSRLKEKRALVQCPTPSSSSLPMVAVPMQARSLPKSMWKEPNKPMYSPVQQTLPRLNIIKHTEDLSESGYFSNRPASPSNNQQRINKIIKNEDEEISLRKLFEVVLKPPKSYEILEPIRRIPPPPSNRGKFLRGHDPCLADSNRFPYLMKKQSQAAAVADNSFHLPLVD